MATRDYYQVLGVSQNATQDEIRKAYKRQAKQHHPDRNRGEKKAEERFKEVSEAYQVLSDPQKKQHYDLFGHNGLRNGSWHGTRNTGADSTGGYHRSSGPYASGFGAEDLNGNGARFEDIFNEIFGGAQRNKGRARDFSGTEPFDSGFSRGSQSGLDMEAEVTISFEDAIKGGKHRISIQRNAICLSCKGTGINQSGTSITCMACNGTGGKKLANGGAHIKVVCSSCGGKGQTFTEPCPSCNGSGASSGMETMTVNIPKGVNDGGRLRIPGKGVMGLDGRSGNLYLRIHITPHRLFKREGKTIHLDLPVGISEAVLGALVEVPTLDGKATLKVPPHTQNGAVLRMKGKGVPDPKEGAPGDMLVRIQVAVPTRADARTKEFYEELKKLEPDPRRGMFY